MDQCECRWCDGTGTEEAIVECPCENCYSGEHYVMMDCGVEAFAPCQRCDGHGEIEKEVDCHMCDGKGKTHTFEDKGVQKTLDGGDFSVHICVTCGFAKEVAA